MNSIIFYVFIQKCIANNNKRTVYIIELNCINDWISETQPQSFDRPLHFISHKAQVEIISVSPVL